jgi:hypothetical protein
LELGLGHHRQNVADLGFSTPDSGVQAVNAALPAVNPDQNPVRRVLVVANDGWHKDGPLDRKWPDFLRKTLGIYIFEFFLLILKILTLLEGAQRVRWHKFCPYCTQIVAIKASITLLLSPLPSSRQAMSISVIRPGLTKY